MLPAIARPLARSAAQQATRLSAASATSAMRVARLHHAGTKADPAIPTDPTGFLPGDKIIGDTQIGNYPNLPMYNQQWRAADGDWWDKQDRRNFGETVAEEDEMLNIWSPDVWAFTPGYALKRMAVAVATFLGIGYVVYTTAPEPHFERRAYPENGLVQALGIDPSDEVQLEKRAARAL
ncbi:hypothetical protein DFQ27_003342 [Actinomortierella ambigua]|uniref:Uncharacterized protein n=1 Tax=Actinomortierella ambigua TaxID=1343610 RepID=A0A9P6Q652_9FUNG|nr:hypothetical protein DFQ26_004679 [Actinomortierella ambigua]KAG0260771.1 hypothetical protein DFQ27_003342 [Actinomortierella ambigua]